MWTPTEYNWVSDQTWEDSGEEEEESFEAVDNFSDLSDEEMAGDDGDDSDDDMMLKLDGGRYGHKAIFSFQGELCKALRRYIL